MMRARRRPVVDEYLEDDRVAIYSDDGVVLVLSELATCAWSALSTEWQPARKVADALVRRFGPPAPGDDALRATKSTLREMSTHGLVEIDES
jgi:hypothetical protein